MRYRNNDEDEDEEENFMIINLLNDQMVPRLVLGEVQMLLEMPMANPFQHPADDLVKIIVYKRMDLLILD